MYHCLLRYKVNLSRVRPRHRHPLKFTEHETESLFLSLITYFEVGVLFVISHDDNYFAAADRLLLMKDKILTELQGDARKKATKDSSKAIH